MRRCDNRRFAFTRCVARAALLRIAAVVALALAFGKTHRAAAVTIPAAPGRDPLAVANVTLIDVVGGAAKADQTVVVIDARIAAAGPADETKIPPHAKVIDGRGKFLIPGLWDMHVHVLWEPAVETLLSLFIANGVTGVRDMHTHASFEQIRRWHKEIVEGQRVGPRLFYAGPIVDGPTPFWPGSIAVRDAESARKAVRDLKAGGAGFVKVYEGLSREAYFAIADEAKREGIRFAGHVPRAITPMEASDAGQHSIEHLSHLLEHCSTADGPTYDPVKGATLFETFKKNKTWQCPTLIVARTTTFGREDRFANDPRRKYFTPRSCHGWGLMIRNATGTLRCTSGKKNKSSCATCNGPASSFSPEPTLPSSETCRDLRCMMSSRRSSRRD